MVDTQDISRSRTICRYLSRFVGKIAQSSTELQYTKIAKCLKVPHIGLECTDTMHHLECDSAVDKAYSVDVAWAAWKYEINEEHKVRPEKKSNARRKKASNRQVDMFIDMQRHYLIPYLAYADEILHRKSADSDDGKMYFVGNAVLMILSLSYCYYNVHFHLPYFAAELGRSVHLCHFLCVATRLQHAIHKLWLYHSIHEFINSWAIRLFTKSILKVPQIMIYLNFPKKLWSDRKWAAPDQICGRAQKEEWRSRK